MLNSSVTGITWKIFLEEKKAFSWVEMRGRRVKRKEDWQWRKSPSFSIVLCSLDLTLLLLLKPTAICSVI